MSRSISTLFLTTLISFLAAGAAQAENWEGPYAGVHAGLADSDNVFVDVDGFIGPGPGFNDPTATAQPIAGTRFPYDASVFAFGFHAGHDWQNGHFVAGIEANSSRYCRAG